MAAKQLLTKINANTELINSKLASIQAVIETSQGKISQRVQDEKKKLEKENEKLRSDIVKLVDELRRLEGETGANSHPVFVDRAAQQALAAKQAAEAATVAPKAQEPEKKPEPKGKAAPSSATSAENRAVDVSRLDFRVGRIISAKKHPEADSLYVEDVDVGEGKNRTVVSGLVKFVPLDQMQNRLALLLCNLKPAKMRGVTSEAMVMCASTPEKVEILEVPAGAVPGDRVSVEGYPGEPDAQLNPKKKIFEEVAPDLKTNDEGIACFKGVPLIVPGKGTFKAPSLKNVQVK